MKCPDCSIGVLQVYELGEMKYNVNYMGTMITDKFSPCEGSSATILCSNCDFECSEDDYDPRLTIDWLNLKVTAARRDDNGNEKTTQEPVPER